MVLSRMSARVAPAARAASTRSASKKCPIGTGWRTGSLVRGDVVLEQLPHRSGLLEPLRALGVLSMSALAGLLWLFTWLCVASVAAGTLVLFAILGTHGQLIALLLFVYLGLASAGGTVPIQGEVGTAQGSPGSDA